MCKECAAAEMRRQAASDFHEQCRAFNPLGKMLKAAFPVHRAADDLAAMAAQLDRVNTP